MSATESHYADLGDGLVHYLTAGQGEPLVLLHGIP
jgi:pimeloyl-ACP methyl ester carboxylesterase